MNNQPPPISGTVVRINGPIITAQGLDGISMFDIAEVGEDRLIGEVIRLEGSQTIIQVYEDNTGLKPGSRVSSMGRPLSVQLGPGLIQSIYDGIQRPLPAIAENCGSYFKKGVRVSPLSHETKWLFIPAAINGACLNPGDLIGEVQETELVRHRIMVPPHAYGKLTFIASQGEYTITEEIYRLENNSTRMSGTMAHDWPVRRSRPFAAKIKSTRPLITGQRVIDTFFPIAKGGTAAIPGGFGTGKTMTQHALAKWSDADIIVYIGCGERGNEMTEVLQDFPQLIDERTGHPLIKRTVMIANTSNMPVPAREVSIYTGVTIAEYYRDMGYSVAVMADSTSRWAEALRELSSRLGDMPAEEGFPSYLATRLAEFYERAGMVKTLSGSDGSITIIGAVSPPGGDFSEPVTQHTTRFVRCFWALDKQLADARHYPSISWTDSYTEYLDDISAWWEEISPEWKDARSRAHAILLEDNRLQQIVKLVGPDAIPPGQRFLLYCAEMIKNAFLQQNSFDPNDMYCSPEKQIRLLSIILTFYSRGKELLQRDVSLSDLISLNQASEIVRIKSEIANDDIPAMNRFMKKLDNALRGLEKKVLL